jgi:hypothetical protein
VLAAVGGVVDWSCRCLRHEPNAEKVLVFALGRERGKSASWNIHKDYMGSVWVCQCPPGTYKRTVAVAYYRKWRSPIWRVTKIRVTVTHRVSHQSLI